MTCKHGVLPSKQCCAGCAELDNTLYRCNQEIIKQTYRAEQAEAKLEAQTESVAQEKAARMQMEEQLEAASSRIMELNIHRQAQIDRAEQAEAQAAAMRCCGNCKADEHIGDLCDECNNLSQWVGGSVSAGSALLAKHKRMREALEEIANIGAAVQARQIAKAALEGNQRK